MTLDVHHPSPADVDPIGEGLSARRCRQRARERDKSQQFHDEVFHGCSPFAFKSLLCRLWVISGHCCGGPRVSFTAESGPHRTSSACPLSAKNRKRPLGQPTLAGVTNRSVESLRLPRAP